MHKAAVPWLLKRTDVEMKDHICGRTALHWAKLAVVWLLVEKGANIVVEADE